MQDDEIVSLFLARDEVAISAIQEKYGKRIRALACELLSDEELAKEVENDTYLKAWNSIPPHEPNTYLLPFLIHITRHLVIDRIRTNKATKRHIELCELSNEMLDSIPSSDSITKKLEEKDFLNAINDFLDKCEPKYSRVFVRRYWFFDTINDIATRYHLSESNVKQILSRMRKKLKKELKKRGF